VVYPGPHKSAKLHGIGTFFENLKWKGLKRLKIIPKTPWNNLFRKTQIKPHGTNQSAIQNIHTPVKKLSLLICRFAAILPPLTIAADYRKLQLEYHLFAYLVYQGTVKLT
jgi:hypothetical protein